MKTTALLGGLFIAILTGGFFWFGGARATSLPEVAVPATSTTTAVYNTVEVATHATAGDCWVSLSGSVYDLTSWINQHPGGEAAILKLCGKDGTSAFTEQHGNDPRVGETLATFKIGALAP